MSRRPRSPAVKTPLEDDDLLGEILLRLPPQPSSLPRASLVCKRWRSLASDPRFRRHHRRNPPLLGFFPRESRLSFLPTLEAPNRVPPGRFSLKPGDGDRFRSLGCRHGLVLISNITRSQMLVWDPVTGDQHRLTIPPGIAAYAGKTMIHGAVLRPAGEVDHFQVVLTAIDNDNKQHRRALACIYSSETGLWGNLISTPLPSQVPISDLPTFVFPSKPALLAGDSLYWMLVGNFDGILEFDLEKQSLAVIRVPVHMLEEGRYHFQIMRAEGGGLGLFFWLNSRLKLWKRNTNADGVALWGLERTIELDKLLPLNSWSPTIQGYAEDNNVMFLLADGVHFMVHLESLQLKKLFEANHHTHYHPFEIVYTAEKVSINGAVLRAGGDAHFQVVLTVTDNDDKQHRRALACVYSSETGLWGDLISTPLPSEVPNDHPTLIFTGKPAVLAEESLYWMLIGNFVGILEFDLEKHSLVVVGVQAHMVEKNFRIVRAEGGGLGVLFQSDSRFQLWKRNTGSDGVASWGLERSIELDNPLFLDSRSSIILGFAEENNVVFLWRDGVFFMVHLESLQVKKLFETNYIPYYHPFESVYGAGM